MKFKTSWEHQKFGLRFRLHVEPYDTGYLVAYYADKEIRIDRAIYLLQFKQDGKWMTCASLTMNSKQASEDLNVIFVQLLYNYTKVGPDPSAPLQVRYNYANAHSGVRER